MRVNGPRLARRVPLDCHGDEIEQLEDAFEESLVQHGRTDRLFVRARGGDLGPEVLEEASGHGRPECSCNISSSLPFLPTCNHPLLARHGR